MSDEIKMKRAREVYDSLTAMLDARDWKYQKDEEKLLIRSGIKGDDLPVEFLIVIKPKNEVVQFISVLPFVMPEDKRIDGAIAVSIANYGLIEGSFDYDVMDGEISFRLTTSYRGGSILSDDLLESMIYIASSTVDQYNDKFFMIAKGMMTIEQFIEMDNA